MYIIPDESLVRYNAFPIIKIYENFNLWGIIECMYIIAIFLFRLLHLCLLNPWRRSFRAKNLNLLSEINKNKFFVSL